MATRFNPTLAVSAAGLAIALGGTAQAANVTLCFDQAVSNVALVSMLDGVENAIVVMDANGKELVKADNYFGNGAGSYWTSKLPQTYSLPSGCSTFYFMTKTTGPQGNAPWLCNTPVVSPGNPTTIVGSVGSGTNVVSGAVIIPATPSSGKSDSAACPRGW